MKKITLGCPMCRKMFTASEPLPEEVSCPHCYMSLQMPLLERASLFEGRIGTLRKVLTASWC